MIAMRTATWRSSADFGLARTHAAVPLGAAELARAALALPIALLREADGAFPAALLSLYAQNNLFVGPVARWLGRLFRRCCGVIPLLRCTIRTARSCCASTRPR